MSVPDTLEYEKADFPFLERLSEYETLGCTGSGNFPAHSGIWLDAFHKQWYGLEDIRTLLAHHRRVAIVSPDLHARPYGQVWDWVKELLKEPDVFCTSAELILCTDHPFAARRFFEQK